MCIGDTSPFDRMLQSAGSCFYVQADLAWVKWAGADPAAFIRRHCTRINSLHIKDIAAASVGREFESIGSASFTVLGQGSVNWFDVMRAARVSRVRYYIIEDESADPARQIPCALEYLDTLGS